MKSSNMCMSVFFPLKVAICITHLNSSILLLFILQTLMHNTSVVGLCTMYGSSICLLRNGRSPGKPRKDGRKKGGDIHGLHDVQTELIISSISSMEKFSTSSLPNFISVTSLMIATFQCSSSFNW